MSGKVYLVGAGPGAVDLLTLRAAYLLRAAEVVLHDDLVPAEILELCPASAQVVNVGKRCGHKGHSQEQINALMVWHARETQAQTILVPMVSIRDGEVVELKRENTAPGDPDLHTHFLIPNAVFCESGRVGSLDTAAISGMIFKADAEYHARLAQKLRDAGFDIALDERTGAARMTAIPEDVCALFSKRSRAGEQWARLMAAKEGIAWDDLSREQQEQRVKRYTQDVPGQQAKG